MSDGVEIRVFETKDYSEVAELYRSGMAAYNNIPIVCDCTAHFVDDKLKPGNDMSNIQRFYLDNTDGKNRCFWVAVLNGKIVGCVGPYPAQNTRKSTQSWCGCRCQTQHVKWVLVAK